jgi:hypothetical protein
MLNIIGIIGRIAAVIATTITLAGCFMSGYDLSQQLKPEFPIAGGQYAGSGPGPRSVQVSRAADSYRFTYTSEDGSENNSHIQFFRVPESSDHYIVQTWTGGLNSQGKLRYEYIFARIEGNKVTFLLVLYKDLPSYIQRLTTEGLYTMGAAIPDGPRDALYILREVLRRGTKLTEERHFFRDQ